MNAMCLARLLCSALLLLLVLVCSPLLSVAQHDKAAAHGGVHCDQQQPCNATEAVRCNEAEREEQQRIRSVLQREVQRAEAAREQMQHERQLRPATNASSTAPLCPLLLYTPQLWRDQLEPDRYTLRLAHIIPAHPAFTHIAFIDVRYALVDSRLLSIRGSTRTARLVAETEARLVDSVELHGVEVHKGEAVRLLVVYRVDGRECNDAPTVLFVD